MAYEVVPKKSFSLDRIAQDCTRCPIAAERQQRNVAVLAALQAYDDGSEVTGMTTRHRRERVILPVAEHERLLLEDEGYQETVAAYEAQHVASIATEAICRSLGGA